MREILLMESMTEVCKPVLRRTEEELVQELTAMMLAYLEDARGQTQTSSKRRSQG